jgi:hypothetical protein
MNQNHRSVCKNCTGTTPGRTDLRSLSCPLESLRDDGFMDGWIRAFLDWYRRYAMNSTSAATAAAAIIIPVVRSSHKQNKPGLFFHGSRKLPQFVTTIVTFAKPIDINNGKRR